MYMEKRKWCYVMKPQDFQISCDICKSDNITWSEYAHHIWCYDCKIDTKGDGGIFSGPIPAMATQILGIYFDKFNLKTGKIAKFNPKTVEYDVVKCFVADCENNEELWCCLPTIILQDISIKEEDPILRCKNYVRFTG